MASPARIHPHALRRIRESIEEAGGNEVFFVGRPGDGHAVGEVEVLARGHASAVPAVLHMVRPGETVLHNHPSGVLTPSDADLAIAGEGAGRGISFAIVSNDGSDAYWVVEPIKVPELVPVGPEEVVKLLAPGGLVSRCLKGYEHREAQLTMAGDVARSLNESRVLLVEAGTGTGKSLAYLLPAVLFALKNRERVVVSTNTINLQEQLLGKDLPLLDQLGLEFKRVLLKGRGNYLCLRKAEYARRNQVRLLETPGQPLLERLLEWARKTRDGSRSDLGFQVPETVWEEVASDGDDCMRVKSPHFADCFYFRSRREAAAADVIVVNHHLLMADLATRAATGDYTGTAVLPPFDRLILDEAHNLEDVAASYLGGSLTELGLRRALGRLASESDEEQGVLAALLGQVPEDPVAGELVAEAMGARRRLAGLLKEGFARIARFSLDYLGVEDPGSDELKLRLRAQVLDHPTFREGVVPECQALTRELGACAGLLTRLAHALRPAAREHQDLASSLLRIEAVRARLVSGAEQLARFPRLDGEGAPECRWVEVRKRRSGELMVRLASAPVEVGPLLAEHLYGRIKSVVLTSATLTVDRQFRHFERRLGLDRLAPERCLSRRLESPFDYRRQALVVAYTDMPEPSQPAFPRALQDAVREAVACSGGRALVLFTSYSLLDRTWRALQEELEGRGWPALKQGTLPRDQLLDRFRREVGSVLFAVDSFWEGIDVPGEALSLVILARLPFRVPTEPLQEARAEAVHKAGGDPFHELTVPQAVIKFRQGFGRLIRTRTDRGAVLILDPRVVTKRYGRLFLSSLPGVRLVASPRAAALQELGRFFAGAGLRARRSGGAGPGT